MYSISLVPLDIDYQGGLELWYVKADEVPRDPQSTRGNRMHLPQCQGRPRSLVLPLREAHGGLVTATVVSPGVVGDIIKKMACLEKGWLQ